MAALVQCVKKLGSEFQRQNIQYLHKLACRHARFCSGGAPAPAAVIATPSNSTPESTTTPENPTQPPSAPPPPPTRQTVVPPNYRHVYPEFLPDPKPEWRNSIRERLERADMMKRRTHIDIPEFYVGTIMAVTITDQHAASKVNRFVGICIQRKFCGLRAEFTLRNHVDGQGVEMRFEMYDPRIQKIEVLRLEKRLDDELIYLRDALPEYCTWPLDMEAELLADDAPVPINPIKVKLRPRPWYARWERFHLKGVQPLEVREALVKRAEQLDTPWEKFDLMKQYRSTIPEEEQNEIYAEVYSELHQLELVRKKLKRKRTFKKPQKTG